MAQGKLKVKTKVPGNSNKKNQTNKAGPSKIKKGNKVIAPKKQSPQVRPSANGVFVLSFSSRLIKEGFPFKTKETKLRLDITLSKTNH